MPPDSRNPGFLPAVRSVLLAAFIAAFTLVYAPTCLLCAVLPYRMRYWWTSRWNLIIVLAARVICGIRYEIRGQENLPDSPVIFLSKHQSAWETIFILRMWKRRPLCFVFKRELLFVPFFGWALGLLRMIPIDRGNPRRAFMQVVKRGKHRLEQGISIVMFPEGTRSAVGEQGKYQLGGAYLAAATGAVVVPVAVNSGEYWPKDSFIKRPGTITVSFGKPIQTAGRSAAEIMNEVETWIEQEMRRISPHVYPPAEALAA
jgi:1-acyl-sn-glycerol-3-phosphate acyltransferase